MESVITYREPTKTELEVMVYETKFKWGQMFFIILLFGFGGSFAFYKLFGWIGGFINEQVSRFSSYVGVIIMLVVLIRGLFIFIKMSGEEAAQAKEDLLSGKVQDIEVKTKKVLRIGPLDDVNDPILCFQISPEKCLYLQGQWIWDPHTYDQEEEPEIDLDDECSMNGYIDERGFPNDHFIITRLANHGSVLKIKLMGQFLRQEDETLAMKPEYAFRESEIFNGSVGDIENVLQRHHEMNHLDAGSSPA